MNKGSETLKKNLKLAEARKKSGLTQQEVAALLNVTKSSVSNWENGYSRPNIQIAISLSKMLNKKLEDLF